MYGKCTGDDLDLDEQIIDKDFARDGLEKWLGSWANIRQMHSTGLPPAGKGVELDEKDDGFYLKARIVEPGAVKLVNEGVYGAYSVGISNPRIIRDSVAKNGRVVGGTFSEISLVDFPANPTTKLSVAKMAAAEEDEELVLDLEQKVGTPDARKSEFTIEEPTPEEAAKYAVVDGDKAAAAKAGLAPDKDTDGDGEKSHAFAADDDGDCKVCGKGKGAAVHNDGGEASQSKDAEPDTTKRHSVKPNLRKTLSGFAMKRLHDALCPAYDWADVYAEYPTLGKDGPSVDLAKQAMDIVADMLKNEVAELSTDPTEIWDVMNLASLYQQLCSFAQQEDYDNVLALEAHATMHKLFKEINPNPPTGDYPKPGTPSVGSFRRPFLQDGHYRERATSAPDKPVTSMNLGDTPSPEQFQRGYLSAGHAREGKAAEPDVTKLDGTAPSGSVADEGDAGRQRAGSARQYYTNSAKQQAMSALRQMHDHLTSLAPELCVLDHDVTDRGEPATLDTSGAAPTPISPDQPAVQSDALAAAAEPDIVKSATGEDITKIVSEAVAKAVAPLQTRIAELEAEPDPAKAPFRGTVTTDRAITKASEPKADDDGTDPEYISFLEKMAMSGHPETRERARAVLAKHGRA